MAERHTDDLSADFSGFDPHGTFTSVPNLFFDYWLPKLDLHALRVYLYIAKKREMEGEDFPALRLSRDQIENALDQLVTKHLVRSTSDGTWRIATQEELLEAHNGRQ